MDVALSCSHYSDRAWPLILIVNLRRSRTTWETRLWVFWGRGYVDEINCGWHHLGGLDPKLKRRKQAIIIPFFLAENTL